MAERVKIEHKEYYTRLKVSPKKQFTLAFTCLFAIIAFCVYIFTNLTLGHHWFAWAPPIVGFASAFLVYPPTEEWEYKPWQNSSEKREQTFFN